MPASIRIPTTNYVYPGIVQFARAADAEQRSADFAPHIRFLCYRTIGNPAMRIEMKPIPGGATVFAARESV